MYDLDHLKGILGVSKPTLYNRLKQFDKFLRSELRTGDHNQTLITENGRQILQRIESLRKDKYSIQQIEAILEDELSPNGKAPSEPAQSVSQASYETVEILKDQIAFLKSQIEKKDALIDRLNHRIEELTGMLQLPPPQKPSLEQGGFIRRLWKKIW